MNVIERERLLTHAAWMYLHGLIDYQTLTAIRRRIDAPRLH